MKIVVQIAFFILLQILLTSSIFAAEYRITGKVIDAENGESLPGATVFVTENMIGIATNQYGFYSFKVPEGHHRVEISYIGYQTMIKVIHVKSDTIVNWQLDPGLEISEITVSSKRSGINSPIIGVNYLTTKTIEQIPVILGEKDVLKTIQLLPGVKGGNEGTAGIQVRGGSHDQNLILLDGIPVYNTNHLFGYLSTFNTDVIKEVQFYKGSIPARYGGRLSSVIDISVKEGDLKKHSGKLSVSPVAGSLMLEGPIIKDTASYLFSLRRSWLDLPLSVWYLIQSANDRVGYLFYDFNGKINWIINPKNRVFISHYQGKDGYFNSYKDDTHSSRYKFQWENYTTLLRWNYLMTPSLFVNTSVYYSLFRFDESTEVNEKNPYIESIRSGLSDYSIKSDFDLSLNQRTLKFGYHISSQVFRPELIAFETGIKDTSFNVSSIEQVTSYAFYIEDEWKLNHNWTLKPGVRTLYYYNGINGSFYVEPKFSTAYALNVSSSIKFSFQRMTQPIHLLTNTALNMPTDLWVPATHQVRPASVWQFDLEYVKEFAGSYNLIWDAYYKPIKNVIQYKQGISFIKNTANAWYDLVDVGDGLNYGAEIMLEKNEGKITGWINYTLAWALRKVDGINNGDYFPFKYDRRHDINVLFNYNLKQTEHVKRYISVAFKLATGNAITVPVESFEGASLPGMNNLDPYFRVSFDSYDSFPYPNNYRMPTFHHLDFAYSTTKKLSKGRERSWKFSVYNVYNRLNPYYYVKRYNGYYQVSLLPVFPSVSFSYNW